MSTFLQNRKLVTYQFYKIATLFHVFCCSELVQEVPFAASHVFFAICFTMPSSGTALELHMLPPRHIAKDKKIKGPTPANIYD